MSVRVSAELTTSAGSKKKSLAAGTVDKTRTAFKSAHTDVCRPTKLNHQYETSARRRARKSMCLAQRSLNEAKTKKQDHGQPSALYVRGDTLLFNRSQNFSQFSCTQIEFHNFLQYFIFFYL